MEAERTEMKRIQTIEDLNKNSRIIVLLSQGISNGNDSSVSPSHEVGFFMNCPIPLDKNAMPLLHRLHFPMDGRMKLGTLA